MTKTQITYIIETLLDDAVNTITPLRNCEYFIIGKQETKFVKHSRYHYYFDTTNELVRIMPYRVVQSIPEHSNYKQINNVIYEYMTDDNGLCCDIYPFSEILMFKVMEGIE